jgi:hypothetical protein
MMKATLLTFSCIILFLFSCDKGSPCPEDVIIYHPFAEGDTNVLVYGIYDTITFVNQNLEEITFVCQSKSYSPFVQKIGPKPIGCGLYTYDKYARITFLFEPLGNNHQFVAYVTKHDFSNSSLTFIYFDDFLIVRSNANLTVPLKHDSILIQGNYIYGEYSTYDSIGFFNPRYGVIKFKDKDPNIWTLKEKK